MTVQERRIREKSEVREKILDAARDLFVTYGYDGVTMRKVAERYNLRMDDMTGKRRTANIANSNAQLDEALARYREQVLVAFRDVEDQLSALRILESQSEAQARAVASATRSTRISDVRYRNGLVSQLDLLDARRSELRNRREALQVRAAQYQATVGLVRALGGGWEGTT